MEMQGKHKNGKTIITISPEELVFQPLIVRENGVLNELEGYTIGSAIAAMAFKGVLDKYPELASKVGSVVTSFDGENFIVAMDEKP
jgi:hypothetical protein